MGVRLAVPGTQRRRPSVSSLAAARATPHGARRRAALSLPPVPCRLHLYGDVYSSPGLDMRQKQLLTCAFLSEANMPDQLFGHALAGLRWGQPARLGWQGLACVALGAAPTLHDRLPIAVNTSGSCAHRSAPPRRRLPARFGNSLAALQEVARLACDMGPRPAASRDAVLKAALKTLDMVGAQHSHHGAAAVVLRAGPCRACCPP